MYFVVNGSGYSSHSPLSCHLYFRRDPQYLYLSFSTSVLPFIPLPCALYFWFALHTSALTSDSVLTLFHLCSIFSIGLKNLPCCCGGDRCKNRSGGHDEGSVLLLAPLPPKCRVVGSGGRVVGLCEQQAGTGTRGDGRFRCWWSGLLLVLMLLEMHPQPASRCLKKGEAILLLQKYCAFISYRHQ